MVFALRGISPELCVEEAMRGMLHHKTIIVPRPHAAATTAQRFMPMAILMPIMAHQQKKKLG